jgi:glycosyltransferase involved in cell wall biosynthesis
MGLLQALNQYVAFNIAVSPVVAKALVRAGVDQSRVVVRKIGSLAGTRIPRGPERDQASPTTFVTLGGLSATKGTGVVADALVELADFPGWRARIYGSARGEYVAEITSRLAGLPAEMCGRYDHSELATILETADWVICAPTIEDTSPQTVLEAQAAGVPVIGADIGGVPFLVSDDTDGILFSAGDSHALAEVMRAVVSDPGIRRRLVAGIERPKSLREDAESLAETYALLVSRRCRA